MPYALGSPNLLTDQLTGRGIAVGLDRADAAVGGSPLVPLDLRALTADAFGYANPRRYQVPTEAPSDPLPSRKVGLARPAATGPATMFGLPVFAAVQFQAASNPVTKQSAAALTLLDPILTVEVPNTIVKTSIAGRKGTVKEYIGQGDYAVSIRGILATDIRATDRMAYPLPQVQQLRALCELGVALPVAGFLLEVYRIKNLVVEDARFEALPGFTNLQAYELHCLSDDPIELAL